MSRVSRIAALLAFALAASYATVAFGTSASFIATPVASSLFFDQEGQDLGGRYLVYQSRNPFVPGSKWRLYAYDRRSGLTTAVASGVPGNQTDADVWNGLVVYENDGFGTKDIRVADLRDENDVRFPGIPNDFADPKIQDNVIVWRHGAGVRFHDRFLGRTANVPVGTGTQGNLGTSRGYVYYQDDLATPNVYLYDHAWVTTECISGNLSGIGNWAGDLAVHDDTIVWRGSRFTWPYTGIRAYDVRSGVETALAVATFEREQPDVHGTTGAWVDDSDGSDEVHAKVKGWSAGSVYPTTTVMGDPSVYGNSVAFGTGSDVWLAEHPTAVDRVAGANRYATAAATSRRHFAESGIVVLASGENWPDALSATGLAGALDCPLLLVRRDSIPDETYQEIVRLDATYFMLVGGSGAVSDAVFQTFQDDFGEFSIQRVAGSNRYHTAARVAQRVNDLTQMSPVNYTWPSMAIVVSGESYADALAAAPLAAARHMPILLTRRDSLPPHTATELARDVYRLALVIGGPGAVSDPTKASVDAIVTANPGGSAGSRWWGADRYATASEVASRAVGNRWLDLDAVGLASGQAFPDALAAGAALGSYGSPLLLTRRATVPDATLTQLTAYRYEIGEVQVFGGTAAVSDAAKNAADSRVVP